ncbi:hypothetical protein [Rugamonas sp.]|uniref:hypothetical protein n=1 Tax=Rugamonas sp. TaxID=1926287 RepID=UPI00260074EB|nr:hypothetical protein [Rugamonas sp.]
MFSDTKCMTADRVMIQSPASNTVTTQSPESNPHQVEKVEDVCKAAISASLKDPGSAIFGKPFRGSFDVIEVGGVKTNARIIGVPVNAKNSYGGYVGEKVYACWISAEGDRFLKLGLSPH